MNERVAAVDKVVHNDFASKISAMEAERDLELDRAQKEFG